VVKRGWMDGWCVGVEEDKENSVTTCGCKDANARLDECCLWACGARLMFRRARQKKRDAQEVKNAGLPRMPKCASTVWTAGARGAKSATDVPRLLHVDEEVALEDVLPFLVLLGLFVRFVLLTRERGSVREQNGNGTEQRQRARSHISSRVWSCTCSNRCLARCGCLWSFDGHSVHLR
jgi:hypothetical protein